MIARNIISPIDETTSLQINGVTKLLEKQSTQFKLWSPSTDYDGLSGFYAPEKKQTWIEQVDNTHLAETIDFIDYDTKANLLQYKRNGGPPTTFTWYNNNGKANLVQTQKIAQGTDAEQITTYDHKPLVGISSITKPNTAVYTYSYDNFNRLSQIAGPAGAEQSFQYFYASSATCNN
jgi:hypothetical protein